MSHTIINSNGTAAYSPQFEAIITTNAMSKVAVIGSGGSPTTPVAKPTISGTTVKGRAVSPWGDANDYPQAVIRDARKNTIIPSALDRMSMILYGGGIVYGNLTYEDKEEVFTPAQDPVVDAWLRRTRANRYGLEACSDMMWFKNCFPELLLSKDRKQIVGISNQETAYTRYEQQNPQTGLTENCFINANWGESTDEKFITTVPIVDPYFDAVEALRQRTDSWKYIYPVSFPSPGCSQYQWCSWHSIRESGWLDVSKAIPEFKKALFKNQLSIKYHIEISRAWWVWKYPDWESKKAEERRSLMQTELENFNQIMSGTLAAGKAVMSTFDVDPATGKEIPGWKVTPVDDKIKSGVYIEDSQEASSHIFTALGFDPTLMGVSPGKGMGAGSGSDKNAAFNAFVSQLKPIQDLILEPFEFIGEYNGWQSYTWRFRSTLMVSMTSGKPIAQEAA